MRASAIQTAGLRVQYRQQGTGDAVILLHGFPQTSWMWRHQIGPLAERHAVFAPDTRGFGGTDKPRARVTRALLARDVIDFMDALGIERAALVGHDWGGIIAFKTAIDYPNRITRLALIDTLCTVWVPWAVHGYWFKAEPLPEEFFEKHAVDFIDVVFAGKRATYPGPPHSPWPAGGAAGYDPTAWIDAETHAHYREAFSDPGSHFHAIQYYRYGLPFHRVIPDPSAPRGERVEFLSERRVAEMWHHPGGLGEHPQFAEFLDFAPEDRHRRYPHPALWIYSPLLTPESFRTPPADDHVPGGTPYADSFRRSLPDLRARPASCGHFIPEEAPQVVNRELVAFLEERPRRGAVRAGGTGSTAGAARAHEDQLERAAGKWALVVRDAPDAELWKALRRVLRIKRTERTLYERRLPGVVRRGARTDLDPLCEELRAAGVRADVELYEPPA